MHEAGRRAARGVAALAAGCLSATAGAQIDLSGTYRAGGLPVQPCGANEWMKRSFETDEFCLGSNAGFPFSDRGLENWASYSPIEDPILRCIETFPRNAMRGRSIRLTIGEDRSEIAYWFDGEWQARTIHMGGPPAAADAPHTPFGYSVGRWSGDVLIVETTHTLGGPLFNDHKPSSSESTITERIWRAPDGRNLLIDIALDDPVNYTKPFLVNRLEFHWAPGLELDATECTPSSIWQRAREAVERD